jgi:hypothetical protein
LSDYEVSTWCHATYANAKFIEVYFDQEIFSGGDWSPSQPGYHAAATAFPEAFEILLGTATATTGWFERCVGGTSARDGAERTKGMAAKTRGRNIEHPIESKQRGRGYVIRVGMKDTNEEKL